MTRPCSKCGQQIDELGLVYGRCHGCRQEFREGQFTREYGTSDHVGFGESKRWKGYSPPTTRGQREKLLRSTARKLDALLDKLQKRY